MSEIVTQETFERALQDWCEAATDIIAKAAVYAKAEVYKGHTGVWLEQEEGKRYIRIVFIGGGHRSAWAFIDKTNGDVLKPDGWKRPAKHARGNIYNLPEAVTWLRWTGPAHLR